MTTDITKIPTHELLDDKDASLADIKVCELALLHQITTYSGGLVRERLQINQCIVNAIDAELERRESEKC